MCYIPIHNFNRLLAGFSTKMFKFAIVKLIMLDFLETILYIIIGLWILRLVVKWAFPYILKYFISRMSKKAQKGFEDQKGAQHGQNRETSQQSKSRPKSDKEKVGEYIDFEEID